MLPIQKTSPLNIPNISEGYEKVLEPPRKSSLKQTTEAGRKLFDSSSEHISNSHKNISLKERLKKIKQAHDRSLSHMQGSPLWQKRW